MLVMPEEAVRVYFIQYSATKIPNKRYTEKKV